MPELPEIETIANRLREILAGGRIQSVTPRVPYVRCRLDESALNTHQAGRRIINVHRCGKYLIIELEKQHGCLIHLGMSGTLRVNSAKAVLTSHDRVTWKLDNQTLLILADSRRFSSVKNCTLEKGTGVPAELSGLGPDALSEKLTPEYMYAVTRERSRPVKNLLLCQEVLAGLGNIYASELLFRSGIRPDRPARQLSRQDCRRLVSCLKTLLQEAVLYGGTTIRDYRTASGNAGSFQNQLLVYGKTGAPCPRCGNRQYLQRQVLAGRSTFFCPRCQH